MGKSMGLSPQCSPQGRWMKGVSPTLLCVVALTFSACEATIIMPANTQNSQNTTSPASRIAFGTQSPSSFSAGVVSTSSVVVTVQGSAQNAETTFSGPVTLSLYSSAGCTGTPAATIVSGGTATASSGVATFSSVNIGGTAGTY